MVTIRALDKNLDSTPHYDRFYIESPAEKPKLLEFIWLKVAVWFADALEFDIWYAESIILLTSV